MPPTTMMRLSARTAPAPELRSATTALAITMPAQPDAPWTKRSAIITPTDGANTRAMPESTNTVKATSSTGRRPRPSESGPITSWPDPMPSRNAASVSCTHEASVCSSPAMAVNDERYMSVANGPTAPMKPSAASRPGVRRLAGAGTPASLPDAAIGRGRLPSAV